MFGHPSANRGHRKGKVIYWWRSPTGRWRRYRAELPDEGARRFRRDARRSPDFRGVKVRCC